MVLAHEVRFHWFGFRSGWNEWKPIKDCVGLMTMSGMSHTAVGYITPELPLVQPVVVKEDTAGEVEEKDEDKFENTHTQTDTRLKKIEEQKKQNRRKFERVDITLRAEIICQDQTYETTTTDVSVGGIAVDGCLPDWIAGYCTVVLSTEEGGRQLEFMCSVVENQKGENYRLELYPSIHTKELERWIAGDIPLKKAE